jgi:hypothetical protein
VTEPLDSKWLSAITAFSVAMKNAHMSTAHVTRFSSSRTPLPRSVVRLSNA